MLVDSHHCWDLRRNAIDIKWPSAFAILKNDSFSSDMTKRHKLTGLCHGKALHLYHKGNSFEPWLLSVTPTKLPLANVLPTWATVRMVAQLGTNPSLDSFQFYTLSIVSFAAIHWVVSSVVKKSTNKITQQCKKLSDTAWGFETICSYTF
jgi:hypothetical protein